MAFQFSFIFVLLATVPWLSEGPRWLVSHHRLDEAVQIPSCLAALPPDDPFIIAQNKDIEFSVNYKREHSVGSRHVLMGRKSKLGDAKTFGRLILGAGSQVMQQFGRINNVSYYLPTVFGLTNNMSRLLSACNSVSYLVFSFLGVVFVKRWARRGLMLLSTAGQFIAFLIITILLRFSEDETTEVIYDKPSIAFFFFYYIAFGLGMLGLPWLYSTEANSLPMRTHGAAISKSIAGPLITNFVIVEITPIGIRNLSWKFWIVWTGFKTVFLPVIYFLYSGTANRKLEDMYVCYRSNPRLIMTGDKDSTTTKRPLKYFEREKEEIKRNQKHVSLEVKENSPSLKD